jgi:hypothetical protein
MPPQTDGIEVCGMVCMTTRAFVAVIGLTALLSGCAASISSLLSPEFLNAAGLGSSVAALPGEAPAVLVELQNSTPRVIEARLAWRDSENQVVSRAGIVLGSGGKYAEAVICPVEEITLGDVSDLTATGAVVRLGVGAADDPVVQVEPFGVLLRDRANYNCGDVVTFAVEPSGVTASGYRVRALIRRSGVQ